MSNPEEWSILTDIVLSFFRSKRLVIHCHYKNLIDDDDGGIEHEITLVSGNRNAVMWIQDWGDCFVIQKVNIFNGSTGDAIRILFAGGIRISHFENHLEYDFVSFVLSDRDGREEEGNYRNEFKNFMQGAEELEKIHNNF